ncbi:MAG TPA: hypothetical protein DHV65_11665 [Ktedonobacter sp.]|nr:hypothetical protein [Ktedonobacter sp.]
MSIQEAMQYCKAHTVFLVHTDNGPDLWTNGRKMPMPLRRAIFKHREQLATMMQAGDKQLCPARDLHFLHWCWNGEREVCELCEQVEDSMTAQDNHRSA